MRFPHPGVPIKNLAELVISGSLNRFKSIGPADFLNGACREKMQMARGIQMQPVLAENTELRAFRVGSGDQ